MILVSAEGVVSIYRFERARDLEFVDSINGSDKFLPKRNFFKNQEKHSN